MSAYEFGEHTNIQTISDDRIGDALEGIPSLGGGTRPQKYLKPKNFVWRIRTRVWVAQSLQPDLWSISVQSQPPESLLSI